VVVIGVILVADVRGAIGFSSFAVLFYYGVTNAAALTLRTADRRGPRALPIIGLLGCAALGASLPAASVVGGTVLLAVGAAVWFLRQRRRHHPPAGTTDR
jgi:APA family basic amino acid/polyamine antiporter